MKFRNKWKQFIGVLGLLASLWLATPAAAALALDGTPASTTATTGTTCAATLTTTGTNDVIFYAIATGKTTSAPTVTGVAGASLTWTQLTTTADSDAGPTVVGRLYIYTANASSALTAQTILGTVSGTLGANLHATCMVFAFSGTAQAFDANASLPANVIGGDFTGSTTTPTSGSLEGTPTNTFSTSNANDAIILCTGTITSVVQTAGSGYTLIATKSDATVSLGCEYKIVSATQSAVTGVFGTNAADWTLVGHALKQASSIVPALPLLFHNPGFH